jgi:hypothetical protein
VIVRPVALNSTASPALDVPPTFTLTDSPTASFIWDATVRCQISSYSRNSSPRSPVSPGVRNSSPDGRIASCASCAFFTLLAYARGLSGTNAAPYSLIAWLRAAATAVSDSVMLSVRM